MSRLADIRSQLNRRGRSFISYGADLVEWSAEKNLAVAADIASFTVAQMRLTIEAQDFAEYRAEVQQSVSGFGEMLKEHGQDYADKLRGLPAEFNEVVNAETRMTSRTTIAEKKPAPKKVTIKKVATKKAAAKRAAPKKAA